MKLNKPEDALKCFQDTTNFNPRDAQAHFKKYEVYKLLGKQKEAQESLEKAISLDKSLASKVVQ